MMKKILVILMLAFSCSLKAQDNVSEILAAGLEAAQLYSDSYTTPAGESLMYNLSNGWYDDAKSLKLGSVTVSFRGQGSLTPEAEKSFVLDPSVYAQIIQDSYDNTNNPPANVIVSFADGSTAPRNIATALGSNVPPESLLIRTVDRTTGIELDRTLIDLGQGLENAGVDFVPTAFLQAGVGLGAGLELKARFLPRVQYYEAETLLYGGALQWQISRLFDNESGRNILPVHLSLLAGYNHVDASYDFADGDIVEGADQKIESATDVITASLIASTKWDKFNVFGALNYVNGTTQTDLLGTYTIRTNSIIFPASTTFVDPLSVESEVTDFTGTLGARLKFGFFSINASYTIAKFDTAAAAITFHL